LNSQFSIPNKKSDDFEMASIVLLALIAIIPATAADVQSVPLDGTNGNIIDVSARGNALWCLDSDNKIYRFDSGAGKWQNSPNTGMIAGHNIPRKIAATNDGGAWVATGNDKTLYYQKPGGTTWTSIGTYGWPVSAVDYENMVIIYYKVIWKEGITSKTGLVSVPGFTKDVTDAIWAALGEKNEYWYINTQNSIYRYNFDTKVWDPKSNNVTGCSMDTQCSTRVVVTSICGKSYIRNGDRWEELPFKNVRFTTINYDAVYAVSNDGKVFKYEIPGYDCACVGNCPEWVKN